MEYGSSRSGVLSVVDMFRAVLFRKVDHPAFKFFNMCFANEQVWKLWIRNATLLASHARGSVQATTL